MIVTTEVVRCMDPSAYGFELQRIDSGIKAIRRSSSRDFQGSAKDTVEKQSCEIRSVIVECETEGTRNIILQAINKRIHVLRQMVNQNVTMVCPENVNKCRCAKVTTS